MTGQSRRPSQRAPIPSDERPSSAPGEAPPPPRDPRVWVTREQLAKILDVHPDRVTKYAGAGMPVLERGGAGRQGRYDAAACVAWVRQ